MRRIELLELRRRVLTGALMLSLGVGSIGAVASGGVQAALAAEGDVDLDGIVETIPAAGMVGVWQVNGMTVQVTEATLIDQEMGAVAVGVAVEVEGDTQPDGSILATEIEVADQHGE